MTEAKKKKITKKNYNATFGLLTKINRLFNDLKTVYFGLYFDVKNKNIRERCKNKELMSISLQSSISLIDSFCFAKIFIKFSRATLEKILQK